MRHEKGQKKERRDFLFKLQSSDKYIGLVQEPILVGSSSQLNKHTISSTPKMHLYLKH